MRRLLFFVLFSSLSLAARAQSGPPYPKVVLYERAARQNHLKDLNNANIQYTYRSASNDYYWTCNVTVTDFFTVVGDQAQGNVPWGTTWKSLTDPNTDHFPYNKSVNGSCPKDKAIHIVQDYDTIDDNYSEPNPNYNPNNPTPGQPARIYDPNNGLDDIANDPSSPPPYNNGHWSRVCRASTTNNIYGRIDDL